jgi:hypothetical protein
MTDQKSRRPYHDHLDVCKQCAGHPFDICQVGAKALEQEAAMAMVDSGEVRKLRTRHSL